MKRTNTYTCCWHYWAEVSQAPGEGFESESEAKVSLKALNRWMCSVVQVYFTFSWEAHVSKILISYTLRPRSNVPRVIMHEAFRGMRYLLRSSRLYVILLLLRSSLERRSRLLVNQVIVDNHKIEQRVQ